MCTEGRGGRFSQPGAERSRPAAVKSQGRKAHPLLLRFLFTSSFLSASPTYLRASCLFSRQVSVLRRAPFSGLVLVLGLRPPSAIVALMSRRLPSSVSNDIKQFLAGYPNRKSSNASANLAFYQDEGPARPSRSSYTDLLRELKGNWTELEYQHGFIQVVWCIPDVRKPSLTSRSSPQWLFPIQEKGMYVAWTVGGHRPTMHTYSRTE